LLCGRLAVGGQDVERAGWEEHRGLQDVSHREAARLFHRADLGTITSWLADELESLQVEVHLNSMVDADKVREIGPDEVIVATGARPRDDGFQVSQPGETIPGYDLPHVFDAWSLFGVGDPPKIEGPVVIFDDTGSYEALSAADVLRERGVPVTLVSRFEVMGAAMPFPPVTVEATRERLMEGDFQFIGGHYLRAIRDDEVEIGVLFTDRSRTVPAKTVILAGVNEPNRELPEELEGAGIPLHLIGDVRGTRDMQNAIHGAAELARAI
ncbi:MAG: hypothetical protein R3360_03880, partial [Alphaproteobacteria bacterium]|nr:hypothetical protein [Alphaproteobacteria bacterium]